MYKVVFKEGPDVYKSLCVSLWCSEKHIKTYKIGKTTAAYDTLGLFSFITKYAAIKFAKPYSDRFINVVILEVIEKYGKISTPDNVVRTKAWMSKDEADKMLDDFYHGTLNSNDYFNQKFAIGPPVKGTVCCKNIEVIREVG